MLTACPGYVSTLSPTLSGSDGITTDGTYLYTFTSNAIYRINPGTGANSVIAGSAGTSGTSDLCGTSARFKSPPGGPAAGAITYDNGYLYVVDNGSLRKIDLSNNCVTSLSNTGANYLSITADHAGHLWTSTTNYTSGVRELDLTGALLNSVSTSGAGIVYSSGVVGPGGALYFAGQTKFVSIDISTRAVTTTSYSGAAFSYPLGLAYDSAHNVFYLSDRSKNEIFKTTTAGALLVVSGTGSAGSANGLLLSATYDSPRGVVFIGGNLYIADYTHGIIRRATSIYGP